MSYNVFDIAEKILNRATISETDELISNLKLQKMLYYMQGYFLARFDEPLFDKDIEAWMYGPVVPCVYDKYSSYGKQGIEYKNDTINLSDDEEELFTTVYNAYSIFSATKLINITHNEKPWKDIELMGNVGKGAIISIASLQEFFKPKLTY